MIARETVGRLLPWLAAAPEALARPAATRDPAITRAPVLGPERPQRLDDEACREHARPLARAIIQTRGGA